MDNKLSNDFEVLSHEFRSPTNMIYSAAQLVKHLNETGKLTPDMIEKRMDTIMAYCDRMRRVTDNILNLTAFKTNNLMVNIEPKSITEFMNELCRLSNEYIMEKGIKLRLKLKVKHDVLHCDFLMLEQIITNLLSNAVKYSRKTRRCINMNVVEEGDFIHFSVQDYGVGIPPEMLDAIFEEHFRAVTSDSEGTIGNGLGLPIVKTFTELLGGTVTVESEVDKGSTFTVSIPRVQTVETKTDKMVEPSTIKYKMDPVNIRIAFSLI